MAKARPAMVEIICIAATLIAAAWVFFFRGKKAEPEKTEQKTTVITHDDTQFRDLDARKNDLDLEVRADDRNLSDVADSNKQLSADLEKLKRMQ